MSAYGGEPDVVDGLMSRNTAPCDSIRKTPSFVSTTVEICVNGCVAFVRT